MVAVGAEGWFHLFDIGSAAAKAESSSQTEWLFGDDQKPCFTQHIPANTKAMLISDIGESKYPRLGSEPRGVPRHVCEE